MLAVIDWLEVGGAQQHLLALARGLARHHCAFEVATSGNEPLAAAFRRAQLPIHRLTRRPIKHRFSPVFTARLTWLARRGGYDLIHSHLHSASVAAAMAARGSGLPLVITHHSMNTWRRGRHERLGHWADRQAAAVIAVAPNVAEAVSRDGVQARIIPNRVTVPDSLWSPAQIRAARRELGIPHDAYLISFVGRFSQDKNPVLFVETAARVHAACPEAHFLMLGDGPLRPAAEARARELGLGACLKFAGFRSDAADLLQAIDVLALTSNSEATPLVVLEAMAAGRPVVATAVGGVAEQIVDGETGCVVPPRDAEALTQALLRLREVAIRQEFGTAARDRVLQHFAIERSHEETLAIYYEVLNLPLREAVGAR